MLHLSGNPQYLWQGLQAEALRILLGYSALTASICALIAFMLKQLLQSRCPPLPDLRVSSLPTS